MNRWATFAKSLRDSAQILAALCVLARRNDQKAAIVLVLAARPQFATCSVRLKLPVGIGYRKKERQRTAALQNLAEFDAAAISRSVLECVRPLINIKGD